MQKWDGRSERLTEKNHSNLTSKLGDYLNARARIKINRYRRDYAVKNIAFAPEILSVVGKIHPEFLRLPWVMADRQTVGAQQQGATRRSSRASSG